MPRRPLHRRTFLKGVAATAALPALARPALAQPVSTLRYVPQSNLVSLDPVWTGATVTTNHAYYVYDTLFAFDRNFQIKPQMAEGYEVTADGLAWRIRLREGLKFHDNTPVRSIDCAVSIERWAKRDPFGQLMAKVVEKYETPDDRTLVIRLTRPFPLMLNALAKPDTSGLFIMPERVARTDAFKAITDTTGSGPYRFLKEDWVEGSRLAYAKFDDYVPRPEAPEWGSGGKVAHFRRIEWHIIGDASTVAAAMKRNEIDWWAQPLPDLYASLAQDGMQLQIDQPAGRLAMLRMNTLQAPFDNPAVRRAVLMAIKQEDFLRGYVGDDNNMLKECLSLFPCGTPLADETAGKTLMRGDMVEAKRLLAASGYKGEKAVVLTASDLPVVNAFAQVAFAVLKELGMNVDLVASDWGTLVQRRASRETVEKGGWSIFTTAGPAVSYADPAISPLVRGQGDAGWFGWWKNAAVEEKVQAYLYASTEAEQKRLAVEINAIALQEVATVPLGQYFVKTAFTKRITGVLEGISPYPWNVRAA